MKERNPEQTRSRILMSAFEEFHLHGFQGARIEAVLKKTGLKKGALYHHFPSKLELGYAVVDEIIKGFVQEAWFEPIASAEDPVIGIKEMLDRLNTCATQQDIMLGCPLNNLAQEMSPIDEGFRDRIDDIYQQWETTIIQSLTRGQKKGFIKKGINKKETSLFIVASITGCISMAKNSQNAQVLKICSSQLASYLDTLRSTNV